MRQQRVRSLRRHDWVVYAKTPLAGPAAVLDYLARYTHRTAIGNERLIAIDGDKVLLRVRADNTSSFRIRFPPFARKAHAHSPSAILRKFFLTVTKEAKTCE